MNAGKNLNRGTVTEGVSREKNPERSIASFVYVSVLWIFPPKSLSVTVQKMVYSPKCDVTSDDSGFFPENALRDGPKNSPIRVKNENWAAGHHFK